MPDVVFPGCRGTGDWVTDQRPMNWREMILRLYPNGQAPLTAVMAKMKSEVTDDPQFHWWEKELPSQYATMLGDGVYTTGWSGSSLNWSSATGFESGTHTLTASRTLYVALDAGASGNATDVAKFRVGHHVTLLDASIPANFINCMVTAVDTTLGMLTLKYLGSAITAANSAFVDNLDTILITGSMHAEGADTPASIAYDPSKFYNLTSIKRTSLDMTRTAQNTHLRTGEHVNQARLDALELHSIELEKSRIWGERWEGTSDVAGAGYGKPIRSSGGILHFLSTNVKDFVNDAATINSTWDGGGEDFIDDGLEALFRYGSSEKLAFCGSGALLAINKLIKNRTYSGWAMEAMKAQYGIKVMQWVTPFGTLYLKTHPLMTQNPATRNSALILDTKFLVHRYLKGGDTKYLKDRQGNGIDGSKSEYLTEDCLELHFEKAHADWTKLGSDGASS